MLIWPASFIKSDARGPPLEPPARPPKCPAMRRIFRDETSKEEAVPITKHEAGRGMVFPGTKARGNPMKRRCYSARALRPRLRVGSFSVALPLLALGAAACGDNN